MPRNTNSLHASTFALLALSVMVFLWPVACSSREKASPTTAPASQPLATTSAPGDHVPTTQAAWPLNPPAAAEHVDLRTAMVRMQLAQPD